MVNLPIKGTEERVIGAVFNGQMQIENSNGYVITRIHYNPNYLCGLADTIATLITEARDQGFKQGQAHVRAALGL